MRRIRLWQVNLLLWAALLLLIGAFHSELSWALRAFPAELRGSGYPSHPQWTLYDRAQAIWDRGGDSERAIELLERSLAIEPNPPPLHLLGRIHATEGRLEVALDRLTRLRELDPSHLEGLLDLSDLFLELDRPRDRRRVLEEGLAWFEAQELLYRPRPDDSVWPGYNDKAREVHQGLLRSVQIVSARLRLLDAGQEVRAED